MQRKTPTRRRAHAPATKQDIALLMDSIGKHYDATERWKNEILEHMSKWKEEMHRHFDVVAEELRHDVLGAFRDHTSTVERRFLRLERHCGLVG